MKTMIIIPTYNEKENVKDIVTQLLTIGDNIQILVVDDNSPDGTGQIVDHLCALNNRVHVIHRKGKLGLGSAYREGFNYAISKDIDYIFQMDADFSHDPKYIPGFFKAMEENDIVIGSRYIQGICVVNWPLSRLIISIFGSIYSRTMTGMKIKDCTSGFMCYRKEVIKNIDFNKIHSDGYSFQIEMKYNCWRKGYRISEIPIIFTDRQIGTSKMSKKIVREAFFVVWRLRARSIWEGLQKVLKKS